MSEGTRHRAMTEAALRECQKLCQQARLNGQHALDRARRAEQARDQAESRIHQLEGHVEELVHWGDELHEWLDHAIVGWPENHDDTHKVKATLEAWENCAAALRTDHQGGERDG